MRRPSPTCSRAADRDEQLLPQGDRPRTFKRVTRLEVSIAAILAMWTAIAVGSWLWNSSQVRQNTLEEARETVGVRGRRITSLNPIRPANAPDPWAREALRSFDRGAEEAVERRDIARLGLAHGLLWLMGTFGIVMGGRRLVLSERQRRRAAEEIERYARELEEANGLKELFIDIMRHDFLNPATAVQSSSMYLQDGASDPRTRKLASHITRANAKLIEMIQDASILSRLSEADNLECVPRDLNRLIREALRDIESPLAIDYPPAGEYPVSANPILGNVFVNLLTNAAKYAPGGERVEIGIRDEGTDWVATVKDFGAGIGDGDKLKVFTRFERLKKEGVQGTGLGLAIAMRIVKLHQGRIWVEDNPAGGAVFCVSLPKAVEAAAGSAKPALP